MAKKYIDAEKLIAEIERYGNTAIDAYNPLGGDADFWQGKVVACEDLKTLVTSLQQEQPSEDLEEELDRFFEEMPVQEQENIFEDTYQMIARYFYELGRQAMKQQMLKDAVEKTVGQIEKTMAGHTSFIHGFEVTELDFPFINSQECGYGDKVKIVIVPIKEDKK